MGGGEAVGAEERAVLGLGMGCLPPPCMLVVGLGIALGLGGLALGLG